MAFTYAQEDAMNARGRSLLVSAAAGSGKTFTLTRRIIDSIIEDDSKTLGRMLIVTFTRSAAAELKKKISDALTKAIAEHPDNEHLQNELLQLGSAHISTIDSFFSSPVKANFEKLGLPASLRLADEAELTPLRESIFRETMDLFFAERSGISDGELADVGHSSAYTNLLSLFSGIRDSTDAIPTMLDFYRKTLSVPDGIKILKNSANRLRSSADLDFFETREGEIIRSEINLAIIGAIAKLEFFWDEATKIADDAIASAGGSAPEFALALKEKVVPLLQEDVSKLYVIMEKVADGFNACFEYADKIKFSNYPTLKNGKGSIYSDDYRNSRLKLLAPIKSLKKNYFCFTPDMIKEHFLATAELCETFYDLLSEFDRRYSAEKLSRGICEFSDMPKFVLKLLQNDDNTPTELALAMQKQYDEVYIDEYQDVNAIQDKIFELIGGNRRFMVGDIKQSIYCFRDAEPSIFAAYREKFPKYDRNDPDTIPTSGGSSIYMAENFRCDKSIVNFVNEVCSRIFFSFSSSIDYKPEKDDLVFNKIDPHFDPPKKVMINLVEPESINDDVESEKSDGEPVGNTSEKTADVYEDDENDDKLYDEAVICGNEIARLIRDKNEKNADGSKIQAGDVAILVRGHAQIIPLTEVLTRLGIKYVTNAKNELLSGNEMKLLIDLLTVIDNPRDDIPLCRVLTASLPYYAPVMTLDDTVLIKSSAESKDSLFDALVKYAKDGSDESLREKCADFVSMLEDFRVLSARVSADKLLRAMSRQDHLASLCETEAYTYLYSNACSYSRSAWNGLYSFLIYFKSLMEKGSTNSDPIKAGKDEVTIITMHQSKGLEYKVCFLFGLGKEFNMRDLTKTLIFNRELGISMKLPKPQSDADDVYSKTHINREDNLLWRASATLSKNKLLEEEARIFYVALTRAKERLYLSATLSKSYDEIKEKLLFDSRDFMNEIKASKSYIRWTFIALQFCLDKDLYVINKYQRGSIPPLADKITKEEIESSAYGITEEDKSFAKTLNSPHGKTDEEKLLSLIPAKVAASKVSPTMLDDSVFIPTPTGNLFSESDEDKDKQSADSSEQIKNRISLMRRRAVDFDSLLEVNKKPTAAEKGSAAHLILQFCDYESLEKLGLDGEIERLVEGKFITRRVADIVNRDQLSGFFKSELFGMIKKAKKVRRELNFGLFRSAADFTADEALKNKVADKRIFVQGSIDLLLESDDGIILCDYKTDKITEAEKADRELLIKNMKKKHGSQLDEYRFAVRSIFGENPKKIYIYSIPLGEVIEIE